MTVRYSWSKPNPFFLPALAAATPLFIYMPAHYLKQFHERYADPQKLAAMVQETQARDWAQLHGRHDDMYKFENPDLPTLQPWRLTTPPPAERFVFERNPYFHRVDANGQQLPYIDRVIFDVVDNKLVPIKTGAGETDLQSRGLFFKHYTFLKESEERSGLVTRLWQTARGAHLAIYPNLNATDEVWRELFRDVRFRRALSLAVDRDEINQIMYFGLAIGGNNTVLPQSPLYEPQYREEWASFDLDKANALLDEIGLTKRNANGTRLLPDGRPMELVVETAGEETEQTDVLELVEETWAKIGLKIHSRPSQREVFRNRIFSGETLMSIWYGLENGIPSADMSPGEFAPTDQQQLQWPMWGQYYQTKGAAGEAPGPAGSEEAARAVRGLAGGAHHRGAPRDLGDHPADLQRAGLLDRADRRRPAAGRGAQDAAQRARGGGLQLGARRAVRDLPAGHVLVRQRRLSSAPPAENASLGRAQAEPGRPAGPGNAPGGRRADRAPPPPRGCRAGRRRRAADRG